MKSRHGNRKHALSEQVRQRHSSAARSQVPQRALERGARGRGAAQSEGDLRGPVARLDLRAADETAGVLEGGHRLVERAGAEARPRCRFAAPGPALVVGQGEEDTVTCGERTGRRAHGPRELEAHRPRPRASDLHNARPAANSRPKITSSRAVCTRQPLSARPRSSRMRRASRSASGSEAQGSITHASARPRHQR